MEASCDLADFRRSEMGQLKQVVYGMRDELLHAVNASVEQAGQRSSADA
jgi:hypothetical protein